MVAVKMGDEDMAQPPELQSLSLKLKLGAFTAVNHIERATVLHHRRRRLMLHRRLRRPAAKRMYPEITHQRQEFFPQNGQ